MEKEEGEEGRSASVKQNCAASAKPSSLKPSASRIHSSEEQLRGNGVAVVVTLLVGLVASVPQASRVDGVVGASDELELWLQLGSTGIERPSGMASGGVLNCSTRAVCSARLMCSSALRSSRSTYKALAATNRTENKYE